MSILTPGPTRVTVRSDNDVYTALMLVAFLFALVATIFVVYRSMSLFGTLWPPGGS